MRRFFLPKTIFEKHLLGSLFYWLAVLIFLTFIFVQTKSIPTVCVVFVVIVIIPNGMAIFKGPIWIIDSKQVRVFVDAKLISALPRNEITLAGICTLPNKTKKLWITNLPKSYFVKYLSHHMQTAHMLFQGSPFEGKIQSEENKIKVGIAVYLHRNDCGKKDNMLFYTIEERSIHKLSDIWPELLILD